MCWYYEVEDCVVKVVERRVGFVFVFVFGLIDDDVLFLFFEVFIFLLVNEGSVGGVGYFFVGEEKVFMC